MFWFFKSPSVKYVFCFSGADQILENGMHLQLEILNLNMTLDFHPV